jgi:hypothetical protein
MVTPDYPSSKNIPVVQEIGGKAFAVFDVVILTRKEWFHTPRANQHVEGLLKPGEVIVGKWDDTVEKNGVKYHRRTYYVREAEPFYK